MYARKALSAYIASFAVILYFSFIMTLFDGVPPRQLHDVLATLVAVGLFAVPVVFVYGSVVSLALEWLLAKWAVPKAVRQIVYVVGHMLFGGLFGIVFPLYPLSGFLAVAGAAAALLYALIDLLLQHVHQRPHCAKAQLSLLAAPFLIAAVAVVWASSAGYLRIASPPLPPFTAADAVAFATSGQGTAIQSFPDKPGIATVEQDGYHITKETTVTEVRKEQYDVAFTERWSKGGEQGERRLVYRVQRNFMQLKESSGDKVAPYDRDETARVTRAGQE